jgi:hypothetical protein
LRCPRPREVKVHKSRRQNGVVRLGFEARFRHGAWLNHWSGHGPQCAIALRRFRWAAMAECCKRAA